MGKSCPVGVAVEDRCRTMWRILRSPAAICCKHSGGFTRHIVTAQEVRTFQQQGVVFLRGVFTEWIDRLTQGIAKNHAKPSKFSEWLTTETTEESSKSFYFNDFLNWRQISEFEEFVYDSPAGEVAGKLMEAKVYFKDGGKAIPFYPHPPLTRSFKMYPTVKKKEIKVPARCLPQKWPIFLNPSVKRHFFPPTPSENFPASLLNIVP